MVRDIARGRDSRSAFGDLWTSITGTFWRDTDHVEVQRLETMDEHFGLGILSSWPWDFKIRGLLHPGIPRIWFNHLFPFGYLLVDEDLVRLAIRHHGQPRDPIANAFWDALPLNGTIVTWIRGRLSTVASVVPYNVDPRSSARFFLCGVQRYVEVSISCVLSSKEIEHT